LARHLEHPKEVYLEDVVPFGRVELLEGLISAEISSIVHKNIDARRLPACLPEGAYDFIGLRHIDPEGLRAVEFNWIDVPSPDLSAKLYELRCDSPADPSSPAGYDGRLPGKIILDIHGRLRTRRLLAKSSYFATELMAVLKGGHIRTIPVPEWVKEAVDKWALRAGINSGPLLRSINKAGRIWGHGFTPKVTWET
jgi:hypothetical protein